MTLTTSKEITFPYRQTRGNRISLEIFLFAVLYAIYLLKKTYVVSSSSFLFTILDYVEWPIYFFIFMNMFVDLRFKWKELFLIAGAGTVLLMGLFATGYAELLKGLLLIVALKKVNYKKLFDIMYRILVISIILTVFLYLFGISDAGVQRRGYSALGYFQANAAGYAMLNLILLTIARKGNLNRSDRLILAIVNLLCFILSNGKTSFFLACITLFFANQKVFALIKKKRIMHFTMAALPIILMVVVIISSMMYEQSLLIQDANVIFNSRIWMNHYILSNSKITMFGQRHIYHGYVKDAIYNPVTKGWSNFMTIDCAFVSLLIDFGIVATILLMFSYSYLTIKLIKSDAAELVFVMAIICLYGLTESFILSIYAAFPFVLLLNKNIMQHSKKRLVYDS